MTNKIIIAYGAVILIACLYGLANGVFTLLALIKYVTS